MKRCKQRNNNEGNRMLYLRTESQGFIKSNSKTKEGGGQYSNHEVFIFLMVHCLVMKHIEISTTI